MTTWRIRGDNNKFNNTNEIVVEFSDRKNWNREGLDWLNWLSIDIDKENDAIRLHTSLTDPTMVQFSATLYRPVHLRDNFKYLIFDIASFGPYCPINETIIYGKSIK